MYRIGDLSRLTGIKVPTIRYFEQVGLIEHPRRNGGNQRRYRESELQQLRFIKRGRELGYTQAELKLMLGTNKPQPPNCEEVFRLTQKHLHSVQEKIWDLQKIEKHLKEISRQCKKTDNAHCPIIDTLYSST